MGMIAWTAGIVAAAAVMGCGKNDACMPNSLDGPLICVGDTDCADAGDETRYCDTGHEVVVDNCENTAHVCAQRDAGP
ncbi:MAG: hypothetical protein PHU25_02550 [Deltaproteobacteria bacterium]|nr:hypothetical protein [Deltaproteobacteria bacterium]